MTDDATQSGAPGAPAASPPITVAIERWVDPRRERYARSWVDQGIDLAATYPGFLGAGWVQSAAGSELWYMLYRFDTAEHLDSWERSDDRLNWQRAGADFATHRAIDKRTGIEGWFDATDGTTFDGERVEIHSGEPIPRRWKQVIVVWLGFFPCNLAMTFALGFIPGFNDLPLALRLLISTVLLTPIMVLWVLPWVTRTARPWLAKDARRPEPAATE